MKPAKSARLFDVPTAEKLSYLHAAALDQGWSLNIDFSGYRKPDCWWLAQLYDAKELLVLTGRGKELAEAVSDLHEKLRGKGLRVE